MSLIKQIKQFINGSWQEFILADNNINLNLVNGEGVDSIVLKYSGEVDETHYGNTNTGESAVVFGEANNNSANRALLAGKLNNNSGANDIVGGLRNTSIGNSSIVTGQDNTSAAPQSVVTGYNNINGAQDYPLLGEASFVGGNNNKNYIRNSIVTGENNENGYVGSATYSGGSIVIGTSNYNIGDYAIVTGSHNRNSNDCAIIGGQYNANKTDLLLALGNGTSDANRQNAFEVLKDGRAKVQTAPAEADDIVRKKELDEAVAIILDDEGATAAIDSFKELQDLLGSDTTGASGLIDQVNENTEKINNFRAATADDIKTIFNEEA